VDAQGRKELTLREGPQMVKERMGGIRGRSVFLGPGVGLVHPLPGGREGDGKTTKSTFHELEETKKKEANHGQR